ncbi:hypothetical protein, partial [Klebsiella pneumoniae]|uniref:hypothetical protein n=1 Tax=Klebsiella pneumoniae TaxID=573 RepID=UPI003EDFC40A
SEFNGEDTFQIKLNPFGNRNWNGVSRFQVNLLNTQSENIAGGRSSKREWRGIWQYATRKQKDGWTGSMRIPWKILNYPPGKRLDMDLN